jgi:hypothetical protein
MERAKHEYEQAYGAYRSASIEGLKEAKQGYEKAKKEFEDASTGYYRILKASVGR